MSCLIGFKREVHFFFFLEFFIEKYVSNSSNKNLMESAPTHRKIYGTTRLSVKITKYELAIEGVDHDT